ncbi:hypothetical protein WNY59_15065 [Ahrensia kielensis]|uniref:Uncharacterized protein n=1 Tax=Ahrensia kielensis TaxID=76980 RepID=A0ABU9TB62_9HYPH
MSSDKIIQQQSELSDANDELIPAQQKRDAQSGKQSTDRKIILKRPARAKAKDGGNGLVDMGERSKRARSSG